MKGKNLSLVVVCLVALSVLLVACGPRSPEAVEPETTSPLLNEMEQRQWEERGIANVKSLDAAAQLAGFPIAEPGYLPDGFARTNISVTASGAGLPEEMKPKFDATRVEQFFSWQKDKSAMFFLTQTKIKFSIGGSEPYELGGKLAERA